MIEVKNLCKSFEGREVLKDINTVFEDGKTNLIIGQSGSGKTVLMKWVCSSPPADRCSMTGATSYRCRNTRRC